MPGRMQRRMFGQIDPLTKAARLRGTNGGAAPVTAVTASGFLASSGGTAPNLTIAAPFAPVASVADAAALTALAIPPIPLGAQASVGTYGALFTLMPASVAALRDAVVLASSDPAFVWVRGATTVGYPSSLQPAWWIDPVAGDNQNDGLTAGTALKEFLETQRRWGTTAPRLAQDTTITIVGDDTQKAIGFDPTIDLGAHLVIGGVAELVATTTLAGAGFQAKNEATGAQLHANLGGSAVAGLLVVNVTHPSHAWAKAALGAGVFAMSQPIEPVSQAMVDTWATTDTVQLFRVPRVNLAVLRPSFTQTTPTDDNLIALQSLVVADPLGPGFDAFQTGPYLNMTDVRLERYWAPEPLTWNAGLAMTHINCAFDGSIVCPLAAPFTVLITLVGGYILGANFGEIIVSGIGLDQGCILDGTGISPVQFLIAAMQFGNVNLIGNALVTGSTRVGPGISTAKVWGTGWLLNVQRTSTLLYTGTLAVAAFLNGTLLICTISQANSETIAGAIATIHTGITITPTALDAPAGPAGFGGTAFLLGGGTITNVGTL